MFCHKNVVETYFSYFWQFGNDVLVKPVSFTQHSFGANTFNGVTDFFWSDEANKNILIGIGVRAVSKVYFFGSKKGGA
jgi:hypothetical protein